MRFATKFDRWIVAVLIVAAAASAIAPMMATGRHQPWIVWIVVLPCMLP